MSAYGTKKPYGDMGVQLTFPAVFSEAAVIEHLPFHYYPDPATRPRVLEGSADLQGYYHEQKKADAHRMAMAGVNARKMSDYRAEHSHAGYFGMPKPLLTQRRYANPSNGNQADIYAARYDQFATRPMVGGVLYTAEAQRWGRNKLRSRIDQLNAIDVAKQGFQLGTELQMAPTQVGIQAEEGAVAEPVSTKTKIEIVTTLQSILSSVDEGRVGSLSFQDVVRFLRLLFRWATSADEQELQEVLEYVDYIEQALLGIQSQQEDDTSADAEIVDQQKYLGTTLETMRKVREYLRYMIAAVNKSPAERKSVSSAYVKALGFTGLRSGVTAEQARQTVTDEAREAKIARAREANLPAQSFIERGAVFAPQTGRYVIGQEPDVENALIPPQLKIKKKTIIRRIAPPTSPRPRFDPSVRDRIGANNGAFLGEQLPEGAEQERNAFRQPVDNTMATQVARRDDAQQAQLDRAAQQAMTAAVPSPRAAAPRAGVIPLPEGFRDLTRNDLGVSETALRALLQAMESPYRPRIDSGRVAIRKRIIDLYGL